MDNFSTSTTEPNDVLFCRKCGNRLSNDSLFCNKCGTKVNGATKKSGKKVMFVILAVLVLVFATPVLYTKVISPKITYGKAEDLFGQENYSEAYEMYKGLGDYSDAPNKAKECQYLRATALRNEKKWDEANAIFEKIKSYKDSADLIHLCHFVEVDSKDPTCDTAGYKDFKCESCGDTLHSDYESTGHNYSSATCTEPKKCKDCGVISGDPLGHTNSATCSRCGTVLFTTLTYSGRGPGNVTGINLPRGQYNAIFTHSGPSNFIVDSNIDGIWVNEIGAVSYVCRVGSVSNGYINIKMAGGTWTITIEAIG